MGNSFRYSAELRDPLVERNREYLLQKILLIAIAAVLSGAGILNDTATSPPYFKLTLPRQLNHSKWVSTLPMRLHRSLTPSTGGDRKLTRACFKNGSACPGCNPSGAKAQCFPALFGTTEVVP